MSANYIELANTSIQTLKPYQPGKPISELERELGIRNIIKMASNENPLGPSAKALQIGRNDLDNLHYYPDANGYYLKQTLAKYYDIPPEQLTLGNGSENIISLLVQAFLPPAKEVVISEYSFIHYLIATRAHLGKPVMAKSKNWSHDLEAMQSKITDDTHLIFIANPNNPTGTWLSEDALKAFLNNVPEHVLVVHDEAYYEYICDNPQYPKTIQLQKQHPNLVITRTFSKAYGLAGLRVGYCIAHPDITNILNRIRLPFNVSTIALTIAQAAFNDKTHIQRTVKITKQGLEQLTTVFNEMHLEYIPSVGNFVTINVGDEALSVYQSLLKEGIIVRPLGSYQLPQMLRITVGLPEQNERLITALRKILKR